MARTRGLGCLTGKPSGDVCRSSAACICCIGPHHRPSGGSSCVPCLVPNADHSLRTPLTSCCGSVVGDARGRGGTRTPKTPCTPTARRLCGVRSRTPRRGQVCCFPVPPTAAASAGPAAAAARTTPRTPATPIGRSQRACCVRGPAQGGSAKAGTRRRWLRSARQELVQTPRRAARAVVAGGGHGSTPRGGNGGDVVKVCSAPIAVAEEAPKEEESSICSNEEYALLCREGFAREDVAAVTIQAYFRAHLARRAFKALRSLVRLQAVARGAYVRRQAEVAVSCMQAMARLQGRVRARQMHAKPKEEGKLLLQT